MFRLTINHAYVRVTFLSLRIEGQFKWYVDVLNKKLVVMRLDLQEDNWDLQQQMFTVS